METKTAKRASSDTQAAGRSDILMDIQEKVFGGRRMLRADEESAVRSVTEDIIDFYNRRR